MSTFLLTEHSTRQDTVDVQYTLQIQKVPQWEFLRGMYQMVLELDKV